MKYLILIMFFLPLRGYAQQSLFWQMNVKGQNILTFSEDLTNAAWGKGSTTTTANTTIAPDGLTSAETVTTSVNTHNIYHDFTVTASTQYTVSWYVLRGTMTDLKYSIRNQTGAADIVSSTSYYSLTNSSTWVRVAYTFTTPVGCVLARIYLLRDSGVTGTVFLWGVQIVPGAVPKKYTRTGSTALL